MYVDKKFGVVFNVFKHYLVLNRTKKRKDGDVLFLDFVNDPEKVVESFGDYYESTYLEGENRSKQNCTIYKRKSVDSI